ncbi:MAG TPA: hypothetical protein VFZ73_01115 [Gemmatimonadaceae bacterium]
MSRVGTAFLLAAAVCQPPEAGRVSGQAGADVGNRAPDIELHGGSLMYSETPCLLPREQCPGPLPVSGLKSDFPQR